MHPSDSRHAPPVFTLLLVFAAVICLLATPATGHAEEEFEETEAAEEEVYVDEHPHLRVTTEIGFLAVIDHTIQFSNYGTKFSYNQDGGQNVLFPITRLSADLFLNPVSTFTLLYQPLELNSKSTLTSDVQVDDTVFPAGTAMEYRYSFPFYRASYLYDFDQALDRELAIGGSLQIRNATIEFARADGAELTRDSNIGLVPLLKFRWKAPVGGKWWLGTEIDGIYAPISYLNGNDNEVVGALLDVSFRAGLSLMDEREVFMNLRYLGGGAVGTSDDQAGPGDGYVNNWLHFITLSLALRFTLF